MSELMITVRQDDYDNLLRDRKILYALEGAGVDNWEGYDIAMETLGDEE